LLSINRRSDTLTLAIVAKHWWAAGTIARGTDDLWQFDTIFRAITVISHLIIIMAITFASFTNDTEPGAVSVEIALSTDGTSTIAWVERGF